MTVEDVALVCTAIESELPRSRWATWPGGYPGRAEAALVDAVFSIRARYGSSPETGVRAVVGRWRDHRRGETLDDLASLAVFAGRGAELAEILGNRQPLAGGRTLKATAVAHAARNLSDIGASSSREIRADEGHKVAYTSVPGLGWVTWEYFLMLLGITGVKADVHIRAFVNRATGNDVTAGQARELVKGAARTLDVSATVLDHAIWAHERARPRVRG